MYFLVVTIVTPLLVGFVLGTAICGINCKNDAKSRIGEYEADGPGNGGI
jgi:hypothetical protein